VAATKYFQKRRPPWEESFLEKSTPLNELTDVITNLRKGLPVIISNVLTPKECGDLAAAVSNKKWEETLLSMKTKKGKRIKHLRVNISSENVPFVSGLSEKITKKVQDIFLKFGAENFHALFRESENVFVKNNENDKKHGPIHFDNSVDNKSYEEVWEDRHLFTFWMPLEVPLPFFWVLPNFEKETIKMREVSVGDGILFSQTFCEHAGPVSKTIRLALGFKSTVSEEYSHSAEKRKREE